MEPPLAASSLPPPPACCQATARAALRFLAAGCCHMSLPYYDLSASCTLLEPQTQRERVSHAIKLGWDAVAMVHQALSL